MTPFLSIAGLQKAVNNRPLLNITRLQMERGQIAALRGENGAGKTTLLRTIAGLIPPDRCVEFSFDGKAAARPPDAVYLHQTPYLFSATVRANVEYGTKCCNLPRRYADEAMEWAGISRLANRPAAALSGGERRRVALARARALRPKLYLLDEPTTHLDADGAARVHNLLAALRQENATAIVTAHDNIPAATTHWVLANGDVSADGS